MLRVWEEPMAALPPKLGAAAQARSLATLAAAVLAAYVPLLIKP